MSPDILRAIDIDPAFAVITGDGQSWIDPYRAQPVAMPGGAVNRVTIAREHLIATGDWKERPPLPLEELIVARWRADLERMLPEEPRLRIFARDGGGWLNPWTGTLIPDVVRVEGRVTAATIQAMARHLATCREARGPMLDQAALVARGQAMGLIGQARAGGDSGIRDIGTARITTASLPPVAAASADPASGRHAKPPADDDLAKARTVQQRQYAELPAIPGFALGAHASPHHGVSGDFYLVLPLGDGTWMVALGDVTGHGMQAALVVSAAMKTLRLLARELSFAEERLIRLLARFNDEIRSDLVPGQFLTLTAALIEPATGACSITLCGHHPAILVSPEGAAVVRRVGSQGMAVGIASSESFARTLRPVRVDLGPGDLLVQYSDGLSEAADAAGNHLGDLGVCAEILARAHLPLGDLADGMAEAVRAWAGGSPGDDLTILALSRAAEPEA